MDETSLERINRKLYDAKIAYETKQPFLSGGSTTEDIIKNLRKARQRRYNGELVQLALLGHKMIADRNHTCTGLKTKEKRVAIFLAQVFEESVEPIWYLEEIYLDDLYRQTKADLYSLVQTSKLEKKRVSEKEESEEPGKRTCLDLSGLLSPEDETSLGGEWCDDELGIGSI
jgi:hypothetical protein